MLVEEGNNKTVVVVVVAVVVASVSDHRGKHQTCIDSRGSSSGFPPSDWEGNNTEIVVVAVKSYLMY